MDRDAFEALYRDVEKNLFNTVYRWLWNREEAMDVVHDAFVKLWVRRDSSEIRDAKAYVFRIAINMAHNRRRIQKLRSWVGMSASMPGHLPDPAQALDQKEMMQNVACALNRLSEKHRQVLLLCHFSGLTHRQIGTLLGIPEGTVSSRFHLAVKKLKEEAKIHELN